MNTSHPFLLAGCGNPLAGDDAFASRVVRRMTQIAPPDLEVADLGLNPNALIHLLPGRRGLIIVDAAIVPGANPGDLLDLDYRAHRNTLLTSAGEISCHGLGFSDQLAMAAVLGWLPPDVRLIITTRGTSALGSHVSPRVADAVSNAIIASLKWLNRWRKGASLPTWPAHGPLRSHAPDLLKGEDHVEFKNN